MYSICEAHGNEFCKKNDRQIYSCRGCNEGISKGESYYKIGTSYFHRACLLEGYDKEELLLLLGAAPRVATEASLACVFVGVQNGK